MAPLGGLGLGLRGGGRWAAVAAAFEGSPADDPRLAAAAAGHLTCESPEAGGYWVEIDGRNVRRLHFAGDPPHIAETSLRCTGPAPRSQSPSSASSAAAASAGTAAPSCEDSGLREAWRCRGVELGGWRRQPYIEELISAMLPRCRRSRQRMLMLGLGGGSLQTELKAQCPPGSVEFTNIEKSPEMVDVAKDFFGFRGDVEVKDARRALSDLAVAKRKFDTVVVDIHDTPFNRVDTENLSKVVAPGGVVLENWTEPVPMTQHLQDFKDFFYHKEVKVLGVDNTEVVGTLLGDSAPRAAGGGAVAAAARL